MCEGLGLGLVAVLDAKVSRSRLGLEGLGSIPAHPPGSITCYEDKRLMGVLSAIMHLSQVGSSINPMQTYTPMHV